MSTLLNKIKQNRKLSHSISCQMSTYLLTVFRKELNDELSKCSMASTKCLISYRDYYDMIDVTIQMNVMNQNCEVEKRIEFTTIYWLNPVFDEFVLHDWTGDNPDYFKVNDFIIAKLNAYINS